MTLSGSEVSALLYFEIEGQERIMHANQVYELGI